MVEITERPQTMERLLPPTYSSRYPNENRGYEVITILILSLKDIIGAFLNFQISGLLRR